MSELKVNKITGITGTSAGAPITISGDTVAFGDINLSSGKSIKNAAGTALLTEAGALGSGVTFPDGHILQCKSASKTNRTTTENTTPTSTGLTVSIIPSDPLHKIYVQALVGSVGHALAKKRTYISISGGTSQSIGDAGDDGHRCGACWGPREADDAWGQGSLVCAFLDAPNSLSEQTYTLNFWTSTGTTTINSAYNNDASVGNAITTLTAWEVVDS